MVKLREAFSREKAPEQDDLSVARGFVQNNGTLFWTMRSAAKLALSLKKTKSKDPVVNAQMDILLGQLKELEVIK